MSGFSFGVIFILMIACFSANTSCDEIDNFEKELKEKVSEQMKSIEDLMKGPLGKLLGNKDVMNKVRSKIDDTDIRRELDNVFNRIFANRRKDVQSIKGKMEDILRSYRQKDAEKSSGSDNATLNFGPISEVDFKKIDSGIESAEKKLESLMNTLFPRTGKSENTAAQSKNAATNSPIAEVNKVMDEIKSNIKETEQKMAQFINTFSTKNESNKAASTVQTTKQAATTVAATVAQSTTQLHTTTQNTLHMTLGPEPVVTMPQDMVDNAIDEYLNRLRAFDEGKNVSCPEYVTFPSDRIECEIEKYLQKMRARDEILLDQIERNETLESTPETTEYLTKPMQLSTTPTAVSSVMNISNVINKIESSIQYSRDRLNKIINKIIPSKGPSATKQQYYLTTAPPAIAEFRNLMNEIKENIQSAEQQLNNIIGLKTSSEKQATGKKIFQQATTTAKATTKEILSDFLDEKKVVDKIRSEIKSTEQHLEQIMNSFFPKINDLPQSRVTIAETSTSSSWQSVIQDNELMNRIISEMRDLSGIEFARSKMEDILNKYFSRREQPSGQTTRISATTSAKIGDDIPLLDDSEIIDKIAKNMRFGSPVSSDYDVRKMFEQYFSDTLKDAADTERPTESSIIKDMKSMLDSFHAVKDQIKEIFEEHIPGTKQNQYTEKPTQRIYQQQTASTAPETSTLSPADFETIVNNIITDMELHSPFLTRNELKQIIRSHLPDPNMLKDKGMNEEEAFVDALQKLSVANPTLPIDEMFQLMRKYISEDSSLFGSQDLVARTDEIRKRKQPSAADMMGYILKQSASNVFKESVKPIKTVLDHVRSPSKLFKRIRNKIASVYKKMSATDEESEENEGNHDDGDINSKNKKKTKRSKKNHNERK